MNSMKNGKHNYRSLETTEVGSDVCTEQLLILHFIYEIFHCSLLLKTTNSCEIKEAKEENI